jgi:23S rRNA pseudouridine1911/1915/1917 synthase
MSPQPHVPAALPVIYEDNHLLVINKPAGWVSQGASQGQASVLEIAKDYLRQRYSKPGEVYLGVVSRLDRPVSGVMVLARTSKAAARLNAQWLQRSPQKLYWALVRQQLAPQPQLLEDWLVYDSEARRSRPVRPGTAGAQLARMSVRPIARHHDLSLLEILLESGRKHQIRIQLASRQMPILGDLRYARGGDRNTQGAAPAIAQGIPQGIALHARRLTIEHPTRREPMTWTAPLPASWAAWGVPAGQLLAWQA